MPEKVMMKVKILKRKLRLTINVLKFGKFENGKFYYLNSKIRP